MITTQDINNIIGITESYELPNELLYLLFSDRKNEIFEQFLELQSDLSFSKDRAVKEWNTRRKGKKND